MRRGPHLALSIAGVMFLLLVAGAVFFVVTGSDDESSPPVDVPRTTAPATPTTRPSVTSTGSVPTSSTGTEPASSAPPVLPPVTVQGEEAVVEHQGNTYRITVTSAAWQQVGAWDRTSVPSDTGHLTIDVTITRTDDADRAVQISWFDWDFTAGAPGDPAVVGVSGDLSGGGYGPQLSTINLEPGEKITGTLSFEMQAQSGVLRLRGLSEEATGQWAVDVVQVPAAVGELGETVRTNAAELPFTAKVDAPRWIPTGDGQLATDPQNDYLLVLDATVTSRREASSEDPTVWVRPGSWQFTPDQGRASVGGYGQVDRMAIGDVEVINGESADTKILLDVPGRAGTLALIGRDGLPVISWKIPGPQ